MQRKKLTTYRDESGTFHRLTSNGIDYKTHWNRTRRALDYYIIQVLEGRTPGEFRLDELRLELESNTGVRLNKGTLRDYLRKYLKIYDSGPFFPGSSKDSYRWDGTYVKCQKIKPPRQHPVKLVDSRSGIDDP